MDFEAIATLIANVGVLPVVVALLVYIIIESFRRNKKLDERLDEQQKIADEREDKIREETADFYEKVLKGISSSQVHTKEEEEENRNINNFVDSQLSCLIDENAANRAYVFLYHNGGKDIMGRSFQKMSITNEIVDGNTVPIMSNYQNVPRSMFPTLYKTLSSQEKLLIEDVEKIKSSDPVLYQMLQTHNVHAAFMQAIKRADTMMLGFVVVEYVSSDCEDVAKVEENLEKKTLRISGALVGKEGNGEKNGTR